MRQLLLVNGVASAGCFVLLGGLHPGTPVFVIVVTLFLSGVVRSIGFTTYHSLAFADVEADALAHANTLNASVQELATGFGIATAHWY